MSEHGKRGEVLKEKVGGPTLFCAGCGRTSEGEARGWRMGIDDEDPRALWSYCPECAEREFGD